MARSPPAEALATQRARTFWDRAADIWEDFEERGLDYSRDQVHGPALLRAIGPLRGVSGSSTSGAAKGGSRASSHGAAPR